MRRSARSWAHEKSAREAKRCGSVTKSAVARPSARAVGYKILGKAAAGEEAGVGGIGRHWASADHFVTTLYTSCVSLAVAIILRLVVPFSFYAQFLIVMPVTSFLLVS
jgi:hypothetical protein